MHTPPGFRAEDVLDPAGASGFLPPAQAARAMGTSVPEVCALARAGVLETDGYRIRPAIVTFGSVRGREGGRISSASAPGHPRNVPRALPKSEPRFLGP